MSPQSIDPSEPVNSSKGPGISGYEFLLSDYHNTPTNLPLGKDLPKPSKLNTTWRDYWKTPATMAALFSLSWIIAILHLGLFLSLNEKRTDASIPQNYVAALSHVLALSFRASLCSSLAIAFTQYLWHIMRLKTVKVSSIERLFNINQNPLLLVLPDVIKTAPVLFVLALFTWVLPIAVTFPPGALIVVPRTVHESSVMTVPTYNGSSLGNNTAADAELKSLAIRNLSGGQWLYISASPWVKRIGRQVLELDATTPSSSPCGPDCAYSIQFEAPYLRCTNGISNQTSDPIGTLSCGENAFSASNVSTMGGNPSYYNVGDNFNMSASRSIGVTDDSHIWQEIESISCVPSRASYTVRVVYSGSKRDITKSLRYTSSLRDMIVPDYDYVPATPQCDKLIGEAYDACAKYTPAVWPLALQKVLTALNHFALVDALVNPLSGNYTMMQSGDFAGGASSYISCGATGGSLVADTRLNTQRDNFNRTPAEGPHFVVSEDILNDLLFDITMSAVFQLGLWNTTVPVNITNTHQVYFLAHFGTILVPYLTCLLLSIPFLCLGLNSLHLNGVSAMHGSFLQVLMTTTGSSALDKAAAGGCLGGSENVPEDLKNMKIRFGEFVSSDADGQGDERAVRRAGFGTDDEVISLRRNVVYRHCKDPNEKRAFEGRSDNHSSLTSSISASH